MTPASPGHTRLVYSMFTTHPTDLIFTSMGKVVANLLQVRMGRVTQSL